MVSGSEQTAMTAELNIGDRVAISINQSQKITIIHRDSPNTPEQILSPAYPKNVLTAFSTHLKDKLESRCTPLVYVNGLQRLHIQGGASTGIKMILDWMVQCCRAYKVTPFEVIHVEPYFRYSIIAEQAKRWKLHGLTEHIQERMEKISQGQVHSDDVDRIYRRYKAGDKLRAAVADSIANAISRSGLRAPGAYRQLRRHIPEFDRDVTVRLAAMGLDREGYKMPTFEEPGKVAFQRELELAAWQNEKYIHGSKHVRH